MCVCVLKQLKFHKTRNAKHFVCLFLNISLHNIFRCVVSLAETTCLGSSLCAAAPFQDICIYSQNYIFNLVNLVVLQM